MWNEHWTAQYVSQSLFVWFGLGKMRESTGANFSPTSLRGHRQPGQRHGHHRLLLHRRLHYQDLGGQGHPGRVHLGDRVSHCCPPFKEEEEGDMVMVMEDGGGGGGGGRGGVRGGGEGGGGEKEEEEKEEEKEETFDTK